jgi:hypothetical protein
VDGPFAPALPPSKVRFIERFFMRGPFAAAPPDGGPKVRLMPAPTGATSMFLRATRIVVDALISSGQTEAKIAGPTLRGSVIEIFPTIFMAGLLTPHSYLGRRGDHTDDLWLKLTGCLALNGVVQASPVLAPYDALITQVESAISNSLHELRAATISAIAADWVATFPPGSGGPTPTTYIAHPVEGGFLLPPRAFCDAMFLAMLDAHWANAAARDLVWI